MLQRLLPVAGGGDCEPSVLPFIRLVYATANVQLRGVVGSQGGGIAKQRLMAKIGAPAWTKLILRFAGTL